MAKNQAKMQMVDDDEVENVGIMSGFMDDIEELMEEIAQQEMAGEGDDADMARILGRSPDSPEVLMNNLRGDYRSIDARREELADRVGYNAAQQTPDEVLAMLQPVFAQQGVAALPMGAADMGPLPMDALTGMPPPGGMPPAAMPMDPAMMGAPPAGMPPMDPAMMAQMPPEGIASLPMDQGAMPPMQMARGGIVQHFERGGAAASATESISPIDEYLAQRPQAAIDPMVRTRELTPEYQELLGISDRGATQAQMLFDIAQAALGYASNVGPDGQPLRGSGAARLAGATRALPGQIGARAAAMQDDQTRARLAALQQAQSEREATIASNTALSADQRAILLAKEKQAADMALEREKQKAPTEAYRTLEARSLMLPEADRAAFIARGGVQDTGPNLQRFTGSVRNGSSENFYLNTDPNNFGVFRQAAEGALVPVTEPVYPVAEDGSDTAREQRIANIARQLIASGGINMTAEEADIQARNIADGNIQIELLPSGQVRSINRITNEVTEVPISAVSPETPVAQGPRTLFQMAEYGTGPGSAILSALSTISGAVGGPIAEKTVDARTALNFSTNNLIRALAVSRAYAVGEQNRIIEQINTLPRFLDNPDQLKQRMITLADSMNTSLRQAEVNMNTPGLSPDLREDYQRTNTAMKNYLAVLGAPTILTASSLREPAAIENIDASSLRYFINNARDEDLRALPEDVQIAIEQKLRQEGGGL
jgi:hypothetical protein